MSNTHSRRTHTAPHSSAEKRALLAKVHIAKKHFALDDDTYRSLLERITGQRSSANLGAGELIAVVEEFKRLGWKDAPAKTRRAGTRPLAPGAEAAKARALWLNLYHLGVIADPAEAKLDAFAKRMTGRDSLRFLDQAGVDRVIKGLRGWLERVGYVEPDAALLAEWNASRNHVGVPALDHGEACKVALVYACWARLVKLGVIRGEPSIALETWCRASGCVCPEWIRAEKLDRAVERIGGWLRAELAKRGGQEAVEAPEVPA